MRRTWMSAAIFFCDARSGASSHAWRNASSFSLVGQPIQPHPGQYPPGEQR